MSLREWYPRLRHGLWTELRSMRWGYCNTAGAAAPVVPSTFQANGTLCGRVAQREKCTAPFTAQYEHSTYKHSVEYQAEAVSAMCESTWTALGWSTYSIY
eukprot:7041121-Prymnesium_polylepis.2